MYLAMKFTSNQIITILVAFLVGVAVATLVVSDKEAEPAPTDDRELMEEVLETDSEEGEEIESEEAENEEAHYPVPTTPLPTTTTKTVTTSKPSTEFVSGNCNTGLSAYKDSKLNAIVLNWSPCDSDNFQFYKLVKSSKNSNPSYPADPVAFSSSNKNAANFVDKTVAARTTYYYRLCVVQRLGAVNCSNVASTSF